METIINYINTLFLTLPKTTEVEKAKEDLTAMMEDKYNELIAEGKKENEAIGIVITEFGNLDELASDLGLETVLHNNTVSQNNSTSDSVLSANTNPQSTSSEPKKVFVSLNVVKDYVATMKLHNKRIALGVLLCIYSPIALLALSSLSEEKILPFEENITLIPGLFLLLTFIGIAVAIFISSGTKMEVYDYLKKQPLDVESSALSYMEDLYKKTASASTNKLIAGVILCIASALPILVFGSLEEIDIKNYLPALHFNSYGNDVLGSIGVCCTLVIVGIAVFLFITSGTIKECYKVITQDPEITKNHIDQTKSPILEAILGIYWSIILIIYLTISFYTRSWHISWIIWPFAGILSGIITSIFKLASKDS